MPKYNARIYVTLKPSILDPQGRTVERAVDLSERLKGRPYQSFWEI